MSEKVSEKVVEQAVNYYGVTEFQLVFFCLFIIALISIFWYFGKRDLDKKFETYIVRYSLFKQHQNKKYCEMYAKIWPVYYGLEFLCKIKLSEIQDPISEKDIFNIIDQIALSHTEKENLKYLWSRYKENNIEEYKKEFWDKVYSSKLNYYIHDFKLKNSAMLEMFWENEIVFSDEVLNKMNKLIEDIDCIYPFVVMMKEGSNRESYKKVADELMKSVEKIKEDITSVKCAMQREI